MKNLKLKSIAFGVAMTSGILFTMDAAIAGQNYHVQGTVTDVQSHYQTVTVQKPQQSCTVVEVPVYQKRGGGDKTGDALAGAIIGGIIGNNVGDVKNGGALGAVIGGMIGHNNSKAGDSQNVIVGYRQENRCTTSYVSESREQLMHNRVTVKYGDFTYQFNTKQNYNVGQTIRLKVLIKH